MNFKRIASIILSATLTGGPLGQAYSIETAVKKSDKTIDKKQDHSQSAESKKNSSVYKDPIYWTILGGGAACLGYGLYKDYSATHIQGTGLKLPADFVGFDWSAFSKACHYYANNQHNIVLFEEEGRDVGMRRFYEGHVAAYMTNGTLRLRDFQLYVLHHHILPIQLTNWVTWVQGYQVEFRVLLPAAEFIRDHIAPLFRRNNIRPELNGFNFHRFNAILADCSKLDGEGRMRRLTPDVRNFYRALTDETTGIGNVRNFLTDLREVQANKIWHYLSQSNNTRQELENWMDTVDTELTELYKNTYRPKFTRKLNSINFSSQGPRARLNVRATERFFNCNKNAGWRITELNANDTDPDVIKDRIDAIFGNDRIIMGRHSLRAYVFGTSIYDANSRFEAIRRNDPNKIELFARILKVLSNLDQNIINDVFKPTVHSINNACPNEFSQYISLLARELDTHAPNSVNIANIDDLSDVAITAAKRNALKQASDRAVLDYGHAGVMTAEYQINLYALLAPLFGLNDSIRFARQQHNGQKFLRWLNHNRAPFTALCNNFFKDCVEGIGEYITKYISGASAEQTEALYNNMGNVRISYNDFKKILSSSHVSNRINSHRSRFLEGAAQGNFETRFNQFIGDLDDRDEDEHNAKQLCTNWKNGTDTPIFKDIVNALLPIDKAVVIYELTMFNNYHNDPAGKAWMGDILIYVYLHCQGTLSVR